MNIDNFFAEYELLDNKLWELFRKHNNRLLEGNDRKKFELIKKLQSKLRIKYFGNYIDPPIVPFSDSKYMKRIYNNQYIISYNEFYLNIWRKVGSGVFGLPIQCNINEFCLNPFLNEYDFSKLKINEFYDVSQDLAFKTFIDLITVSSRKTFNSFKRDVNRLLDG